MTHPKTAAERPEWKPLGGGYWLMDEEIYKGRGFEAVMVGRLYIQADEFAAAMAPEQAAPVRSQNVTDALHILNAIFEGREGYLNSTGAIALIRYISALEQQSDTSGLRARVEALEGALRDASTNLDEVFHAAGGNLGGKKTLLQAQHQIKMALLPSNPEESVG